METRVSSSGNPCRLLFGNSCRLLWTAASAYEPRRERPVTTSSSLMFSDPFRALGPSTDSGSPWSRADLVEA
eukprot:5143685-Pyramimonas_sp.AAC.1